MRTPLVALVSVALVATGCGSDAPGADDVLDTLPDAGELTERAEELGISPLALALDDAASSVSYRASMSMGMDMSMGGFGQALSFEADPATPMMVFEADAEGQQYSRVDIGVLFESMSGSMGLDGDDLTGMFGDDLAMETWVDGTTMTVDLGGLGSMLAMSGTPFPADVFTVDLAELGAGVGGADVASALSGQAAPDPVEMAEVLRDVLEADADGDSFSGTIGFLDYSRAFGQDPTAMLGGTASGLDDLIGPEAEQAMLDVFESIEADVSVTLAGGAVDVVRFDVDLSPMFQALSAMMSSLGDEVAAGGDAELDAIVGDATFTMTMLIDYDLDAAVDVVVPSGDIPDATADFLALFGDSLGA